MVVYHTARHRQNTNQNRQGCDETFGLSAKSNAEALNKPGEKINFPFPPQKCSNIAQKM